MVQQTSQEQKPKLTDTGQELPPSPIEQQPQSPVEQPPQSGQEHAPAVELPVEIPTQPQEQEKSIEQAEQQHVAVEDDKSNIDTIISTLTQKLHLKKKKPTSIPTVKDELTTQIEKVMEEGLADAYQELTPIQQQEFKIKGEETAWQIRELMKKTHVKIKEIFKILLEWLKLLPGINKFYLEQEAKIKADKIITLKNMQNK